MKDDRGVYYYPFPQNMRVRMYVCETGEGLCFRLWNADDPGLWEEHGWVPYDAIKQARVTYKGEGFDPDRAYDPQAARELLRNRV
ncbi:MAG: hypothetical protein DRI57_19375 [Deltaproteobacteria bacterium]|nr:MAG: hypothetical protein DRI57_19375 [Deltaproteobacteria bacterium]